MDRLLVKPLEELVEISKAAGAVVGAVTTKLLIKFAALTRRIPGEDGVLVTVERPVSAVGVML
jgi:hypothetical protein